MDQSTSNRSIILAVCGKYLFLVKLALIELNVNFNQIFNDFETVRGLERNKKNFACLWQN